MKQPKPLEPPLDVASLSECDFYHKIDLPSGTTSGQWDLRGRLSDYLGNTPMKHRRVVDVGTASGFLTFGMEQLGATVTSFDAASAKDIAYIPIHSHPFVQDYAKWCEATDSYLRRLKNSYWYAHKALGSRSSALYGNVYEIDSYGYQFDIAVVGQLLIHLKDPVNALASISRVCRDTLIIAEGTHDSNDTVAKMWARAKAGGPPYIWWQLSVPLYRELLAMLGFQITSITTNSYPCDHEYVKGMVPITTIVAKRNAAATLMIN